MALGRSMGRPRIPDGDRRTASLNPRLTDAEKAEIERHATLLGISPGEFMRRRALGYRLPVTLALQREEANRNTALIRLGVNLNQIARHANAGRGLPDHLSGLLAQIGALLDSLYDRR